MSIFSKLRRAKQAANEQKGKAAAGQSKPESAPYKHVPTHAASDALLGSPATSREQEKKAIQAQNQRRGQYGLSRNPSSLSNVTTLNRDQSFTLSGGLHAPSDKRKHHSTDSFTLGNGPRTSQSVPIRGPSGTRLSRQSQPPSPERANRHVETRTSRFETVESAPKPAATMNTRTDFPLRSSGAPAKDVKFYLPESRETSPGPSSDNSNRSSRGSSVREPAVSTRHPRRPPTLGTSGPSRRVEESPTLPPSPLLRHLSPSTHIIPHMENDLNFIDFGSASERIDFAVTAH